MENQSDRNQQSISSGQGIQINQPQAPVAFTQSGDIHFHTPAPTPPSPLASGTPHNLPYSGAIAFIGRGDDLQRLHDQLQTAGTIAVSSISGMGGIGKTELAWRYANQQLSAVQPPAAICWLRAREDLGTQIISFGRNQLGMTIPQEQDFATQVAFCWEHLRSREALVIFDDVQKFEDVRSFLTPSRSRLKILLTTRSRFGQGVQPFEIKVLTEAQSLELLRAFTTPEQIDAELETAKEICRWLGYLPLGLELVGRYLARKPDTTLATLWEQLQRKQLDAIALKQAAPEMTAELGVAAAFELSWQELDQKAQQLAAFLSLFALAEIPWELVQAGLPKEDPEELEEVRDRQLVDMSLLTRTGQGMYELHQLLREFFAVKISEIEQKKLKGRLAMTLMQVAREIPHLPSMEDIQAVKVAIPHLKQVAADLQNLKTQDNLYLPYQAGLDWVFIGISRFYYGQGMYAEAEYWDKSSLAINRALLGEEHPDTARSLNNLAVLYTDQGRYAEAEPLLLQALKVRQSFFGEQDSDVAQSLNTLGVLYRIQGRYAEAEPLLLQALKIRRLLFGKKHWEIADSLGSLAALYRAQGCYEKAEPLYLEALELDQSFLGKQHPTVASRLNNLALLYRDQERYQEAERLLLQALKVNRAFLGEQHPAVITNLNHLATLYHTQERYQEAERLYLQACLISDQKLGTSHPDTKLSYKNFLLLLNEALQRGRTTELSDHPITRSLLKQLQPKKPKHQARGFSKR